MTNVHQERNRSIVDALNTAREQLAGSEIGWDSLEDDGNFLAAVDRILEELGVQLEARDIPNAEEIKALRDGVAEYIAKSLTSPDAKSAAARPCTCDHGASMHVWYGCSWEDSTGGEPNICQCVHAAAFTQAQFRPTIETEIARKSGIAKSTPDIF